MTLTQSQRILITVAALFVGMGVLGSLVAFPALRQIVALAERIAQERAKTEAHYSRALQFRQTTESVEKIKAELPLFEKMLILRGQEVDFFALLEKKNKAHDLEQIIRLDNPKPIAKNLEEIPLEFQLRGPFLNILQYLDELERSDRIVAITNIDLRFNPQAVDAQKPIAATFSGNIYVTR